MTIKLLKFQGKQYRAVNEVEEGCCTGCVFETPNPPSCLQFHRAHSEVSCVDNECIYVEGEENAAS